MPSRRAKIGAVLGLALLVGAAAAGGGYAMALQRRADDRARELTGGEPAEGPQVMIRYGCAGCHDIPDVRGPGGRIGPPLGDVAARVYLGGRLVNTPENLIRWIVDPRAVDPKTAMPVTGISQAEARHAAAYLIARRR